MIRACIALWLLVNGDVVRENKLPSVFNRYMLGYCFDTDPKSINIQFCKKVITDLAFRMLTSLIKD